MALPDLASSALPDDGTDRAAASPNPNIPRRTYSPWWIAAGLAAFVGIYVGLVLWGVSPYPDGAEESVPDVVRNPPGLWFFNIVIPVLAVFVFVRLLISSIKQRTLSYWLLFFVAGGACFFYESIGDWAFYLTYSPDFWHYELPWSFPWHVRENPVFMPFAYALYWTAHGWAVVRASQWWSRRSGWSELRSLLVLAVPISYAWDLLVEGVATYFGWWQYDPPLGPYLSWEFIGGEGNMPLTFPILIMLGWCNIVAWVAGDPTVPGVTRLDRMFRLDRMLPAGHQAGGVRSSTGGPRRQWAWNYEIARIGAWVMVFWWSFGVLQIVPIIAIRYLFGHDSVYAPWPQ